jgi:hypothetical protein
LPPPTPVSAPSPLLPPSPPRRPARRTCSRQLPTASQQQKQQLKRPDLWKG